MNDFYQISHDSPFWKKFKDGETRKQNKTSSFDFPTPPTKTCNKEHVWDSLAHHHLINLFFLYTCTQMKHLKPNKSTSSAKCSQQSEDQLQHKMSVHTHTHCSITVCPSNCLQCTKFQSRLSTKHFLLPSSIEGEEKRSRVCVHLCLLSWSDNLHSRPWTVVQAAETCNVRSRSLHIGHWTGNPSASPTSLTVSSPRR